MRPITSYFSPEVMAERLASFAELKEHGWQWTGEMYQSHKRGLAHSLPGLRLHAPALKVMLDVCPTAFPSFRQLKLALEIMNKQFGIFEGCGTSVDIVSERSSDRWRIMLKDVDEIAKDKIVVDDPIIEELVGMVKLRVPTPAIDVVPTASLNLGASMGVAPLDVVPLDGESDVEIELLETEVRNMMIVPRNDDGGDASMCIVGIACRLMENQCAKCCACNYYKYITLVLS